ncbi:MAG: class I SAM-dependent methyltransferase [archaeon]
MSILTKDYDLSLHAFPHYMELQRQVAHQAKSALEGITEPLILELGCGTGITTRTLLENIPDAKIIAVDKKPKMLDQAMTNLKDYDNIEFALADAMDVGGIRPHAVVTALMMHNLHHKAREQLLRNIYDMQPYLFVNGDKMASDDFRTHRRDYEWVMDMFGVYDRLGRSDFKQEYIRHYERDNRPDFIQREGETLELMAEIGFIRPHTVYRERMEAVVVGLSPANHKKQ